MYVSLFLSVPVRRRFRFVVQYTLCILRIYLLLLKAHSKHTQLLSWYVFSSSIICWKHSTAQSAQLSRAKHVVHADHRAAMQATKKTCRDRQCKQQKKHAETHHFDHLLQLAVFSKRTHTSKIARQKNVYNHKQQQSYG